MDQAVSNDYKVKLEVFEGPLDLLLYLINKNEVDIYDIPISLISSQYIEYLEFMKTLNLDIAGDFLLMAATLTHIKSQMLVPTPLPCEDGSEVVDPRSELVKQLLEYQRYKEAADSLLSRELLNRDVFKRENAKEREPKAKSSDIELVEFSIFNLIDIFSKILKKMPEDFPQEFYIERLTIRERITEIAELLFSRPDRVIGFRELFSDVKNRSGVIVTFLAILEMIKMSLVRAVQGTMFGDIMISATTNLGDDFELGDDEQESN